MGALLTPISGVHHNIWHSLWIWQLRHCGFYSSVYGCRFARRPLGLRADPRPYSLVTPVDYVELRALAIARQEIDGRVERSDGFKPGTRVLRLWPFRWPAHEPEATPPEPAPAPAKAPGQYIDILF